ASPHAPQHTCGLARPTNNRTGKTIPSNNEDRAPLHPITASFGAAARYRGFKHWFVSYAFLPCYRTRPAGGKTVARSSGAAPALHLTSGIRLPLSFSRPLRRPEVGSFHTHPVDGASW